MSEPQLRVWTPRRPVRAVALVLHGGRSESTVVTSAWQLAALRMLPFDRALRRAGGRHGLAVARLRYRVRGWNGADQDPVRDARWALDRLHRRFPDRPVALLGHSMGGRTALHVADDPSVSVVVALAPWIEPGDPGEPVTGRRLLLMHGERDIRTDPRASARFGARVHARAGSVAYLCVRGDGHAMLHRWRLWHRVSAGFVVGGLFPRGARRRDAVVDRALAGTASLTA